MRRDAARQQGDEATSDAGKKARRQEGNEAFISAPIVRERATSRQQARGTRQRQIVRPTNGGRESTICPFAIRYSLFAILSTFAAATGQSGGGYVITKSTIDGGGHSGLTDIGGNYKLSGTVGQHDAGDLAGGSYFLTGGFWSPVSSGALPPLEDPAVVFPSDHSTVNKNRFISVVIPSAAAGQELGVRVELVSMPGPPTGTSLPSGRLFRYVTGFGDGTDFDCNGSINFGQPYRCGQLVCSDSGLPIYRDWGDMAGEVLHITGDAVHADSQYAASLIPQSCGDTASADACAGSTPLALNTAVWGDHADAGGDPLALDGVANVIDISFAVDKVKDLATAFPEPRIWKKDADPDPNGADINVLDAAFTVDAVKSLPYPASFVITVCP